MRKNRYSASATPKQLAYLRSLAKQVRPNEEATETLLAYGAPRTEYTGGFKTPTMAEASNLIDRLKRALLDLPQADVYASAPDPGELTADRWAESQVGL